VPHVFWTNALFRTLAFLGVCFPLVIGAALGQRNHAPLWADVEAERVALLALLVASAIGAAAGGRFYPHYYIQLIPPLALLAAPFYARLLSRNTQPHHWFMRLRLMSSWLALTAVAFSISHWLGLASQRAPSEAGQFLLKHSKPKDRIFVWGHAPNIYLDAQRRPACRYILTFPLTGYIFGGPVPGIDSRERIIPGAWATLEQDFRKHPPSYIVDTESGPSGDYPVQNFPVLAKLLAERYLPIARTNDGVIYRLDGSFR